MAARPASTSATSKRAQTTAALNGSGRRASNWDSFRRPACERPRSLLLPRDIRVAFEQAPSLANASAGVTEVPALSAARASWAEFQYAGSSRHTCSPSRRHDSARREYRAPFHGAGAPPCPRLPYRRTVFDGMPCPEGFVRRSKAVTASINVSPVEEKRHFSVVEGADFIGVRYCEQTLRPIPGSVRRHQP